ncbi:hypothetical protein WICPIJ_006265 [Wickerhamomyces pijperi]|uniref:HORMA domain-containing protein n=1 Tax=Wickerhamomyces pijperi TaxID=599730 RepID=A0A9P8TLL2_WICPI|nr:hypothetical protein WICPIJ_006265 [Wickerhamomyces pijperi]
MVVIKEPVRSQLTNEYPITINNLLYQFQLYIKSWLNIIFCERNLYPASNFTKRRLFELEVLSSRHPALNEWFRCLIEDIFDGFERVKVISLRIYEEVEVSKESAIGPERTLEVYHLNLSELQHISSYEGGINDKLADELNENESLTWDDILTDFRSSLHSFMLKIRTLKKFDKAHKFSISIESDLSLGDNWILEKSGKGSENVQKSEEKEEVSKKGNSESINIAVSPIDVGPIIVYPLISLFNQSSTVK